MADKENVKGKTRQIYEILPHLDDQRCGYRTCGEFAHAVAEGKAPCDGCVMGGREVAARVCQIMGMTVVSNAGMEKDNGIPQFSEGNIGNWEPGKAMDRRLFRNRRIRMGGCGMHAGHRKGRGRR